MSSYKKKYIVIRKGALVFLIVVLGAIGYFGFAVYGQVQQRRAVKKRIAVLPHFQATTLDDDTVSSRTLLNGRPVIITYFSPECHFCQHEIKSIQKSNLLRKRATIWLISDFPRVQLQQFNKTFLVDTTSKLHIYRDREKKVKKIFGVEGVPNTFVYGKDGKLLKHFKGETKADVLYRLVK